MTDKIRLRPDQIVSKNGQKVAFVDDGGTLRNTVLSKIEIMAEGDDSGTPETSATAVDSEPAGIETEGEPVEVPPSSEAPLDTQPETEAAAPAKPARKRNVPKETKMATQTASSAGKAKIPPKAKVTAKKAPAKRASAAPKTETTGVRTIGGKAVDLTGYEKTKAPGGGTSYHNGDSVASKLEGKTLDEAYDIASKVLKVEAKELRKKYANLNVGMQRMALGNRMRKVLIPKAVRTN